MNGPEHYREAERLLQRGLEMSQSDMASSDATGLDIAPERIAEADLAIRGAQVHATLAVAAATAMQAAVDGSEPGMADWEFRAWYAAAGVRPVQPATDREAADDEAALDAAAEAGEPR